MELDYSDVFLSKGVNYLLDDKPLISLLKYLSFTPDDDMKQLGSFVSESLIETADFIDHYAKPVLRTWGILGNRIDAVWISPEHRRLLQELQSFGVVRKGIVAGDMFYHYLSGYLISDSGIFCTLTLTAQTAYALKKYGRSAELEPYLEGFLDSRRPFYGATYYSEIQGGSDLGKNSTIAEMREGEWELNGQDKYFASNAGIADGAIVTARRRESKPGAKGISIFFVPARRRDGSANYEIRRLKEKLGTIAVPTGEVEFSRTEAYPLGDMESGIYPALEILTISRIDDALAALGIARKALWESYLYAQQREAFGKRIIEHPLLARDFIELESLLEGALALSLVAAKRFSSCERQLPPYDDDYHLARMLTHMAKNMASEVGAKITRYALEIVGGRGFFSEFPLEKFHRDEIVTAIWEGTSNIQALDLLELVTKKQTHLRLYSMLRGIIGEFGEGAEAKELLQQLDKCEAAVGRMMESGNAQFYGKDILNLLAVITASVLLFDCANSTSDVRMKEVAGIFLLCNVKRDGLLSPSALESFPALNWMGKKAGQ